MIWNVRGAPEIIKVTEQGLAQLGLYKEEWKRYSSNISMVFEEESTMNRESLLHN